MRANKGLIVVGALIALLGILSQRMYAADTTILGDIVTSTLTVTGPVSMSSAVISSLTASSATITNLSVTGGIPSSSVKGTVNGSDASAGYLGQYIESTVVSDINAAATNVFDDLTSISLTAGDWDVTGGGYWNNNGANWARCDFAISTSSGDTLAGLVEGSNDIFGMWSFSTTTPIGFAFSIPVIRFNVATTTIVYFKRRATYTSGTPITRSCKLSARRVR